MASMYEVLNGIHTDGKDPYELHSGHRKLATIDIYSYQDSASADLIYRSQALADDEAALIEWLVSNPPTSQGQQPSGGLKLLVVHAGIHSNAAASLQARRMLKIAFDNMQLPTASLTTWWTLSSDFMSFPRTVASETSWRQAYCLLMGHWALSWSYDSGEKFTRGIIIVERDHGQELPDPLETTINALKEFADQPCFLEFVASIAALTKASASISKTSNDAKDMKYRLRGYRDHESDAVPALTDHSKASTDVMNHTSRVQGYHDRLRILRGLNSFFVNQSPDLSATILSESEVMRQRAATLRESLIQLEQKVASLMSVTQKLKDRGTMQLAVLFNIIAKRDSKASIEIAAASRALAIENKKDQRIAIAIAKASRQIAVESKRDSLSMKTIAAVTMIFLPGTFVA